MENEVVIHVKTRSDEARRGFADIERDAKRSGKQSGDSLSTGLSGTLMRTFAKLGESLTEALGSVSAKLPGIMGSAVSSLPPQGQAIALVLVAGLAVSLAPLLAAAISTAVLMAAGGGVLVAGIMAAAQDPKVKAAFATFGKVAKDAFKDFGEPFKAPLIRAAGTFTRLIKDIGPQVNDLGKIIAPVVDMLAPALANFIKNAMPGIKDAVKASVPLFKVLADKLPDIGQAISEFFSSIAESGPDAAVFFSDLLDAISGIIKAIGVVIGWLAKQYIQTRRTWQALIEGVSAALNAVNDFVNAAAAHLRSFGKSVGNAISTAIGWVKRIIQWFKDLPGAVRDAAGRARDSIANAFKAARDKAVGWIKNMASEIWKAITNLPKTVTINIVQKISSIGSALWHGLTPFAHGGIVGAATGGIHSGLRMVGEHGPELADLPPGTQVHSNPDSQRMMGGQGGGGSLTLVISSGGTRLDDLLVEVLRNAVRVKGAGNVQTLLGQPGRA